MLPLSKTWHYISYMCLALNFTMTGTKEGGKYSEDGGSMETKGG